MGTYSNSAVQEPWTSPEHLRWPCAYVRVLLRIRGQSAGSDRHHRQPLRLFLGSHVVHWVLWATSPLCLCLFYELGRTGWQSNNALNFGLPTDCSTPNINEISGFQPPWSVAVSRVCVGEAIQKLEMGLVCQLETLFAFRYASLICLDVTVRNWDNYQKRLELVHYDQWYTDF